MPERLNSATKTRLPAAVLLVAAWMPAAFSQTNDAPPNQSFTVVELFTSQGCSSCPPADQLLRQIAEKNERTRANVFPLSFHVDYWNRLGWTDPFSAAAYSQRQRAYARLLREDRVYTPQMIVGGTDSFVGSNGKLAKAAIARALSDQQPGRLKASATTAADGTLQVRVTAMSVDDDTLINFALVQTEAATEVPRGENANRRLTHRNVVRDFKVSPLAEKAASATLTVPADVGTVSVVVYAQEASTGKIVAATRCTPVK